ncbi:MAG TPA: type III polyketide synthase [Phycisphaerales bacterium]|nr:type III polyketide synthase [Phycisphaerales bacterium]
MSARAAIVGVGTSVPPCSIARDDSVRLAMGLAPGLSARGVAGMYERSGVDRRGSVLLNADGSQSFYAPTHDPTTRERMQRFAREAGTLAASACRDALTRAGVSPVGVTHVVTASCTGFSAPGVDQALVESLGLPTCVERTHIGFMGCHAAVNALRVAGAFARAHERAVVLVCCAELSSLHYQFGDAAADSVVANALFADGAAAAVVSRSDSGLAIRSTSSALIPGTRDLMSWTIGDHGFVMTLSPKVPDVLASEVPGWIGGWLGRNGQTAADIDRWAIHPGGPRLLRAVAGALSLREEQWADSREVLAQHGNMSSPTVLFILDRLVRRGVTGPIAMLAFGPGLAAEGVLLDPSDLQPVLPCSR